MYQNETSMKHCKKCKKIIGLAVIKQQPKSHFFIKIELSICFAQKNIKYVIGYTNPETPTLNALHVDLCIHKIHDGFFENWKYVFLLHH